MLLDFIFSDDFDCTFDFGLFVLTNSYLAEAAFSEYISNFVSVFDVFNKLEPFKIFKRENLFLFLCLLSQLLS